MREVAFNCSICLGQCGMHVVVDGERIVEVLPDPTHPGSRGYTCPKGRSIPSRHHDPNRLDRPRLHGVEVSWDVFLDDLAARFQRQIDEGGPDRIASFVATFGDGVGTFFEALGTKQRYSSLTLDIAPMFRAAELVTGFAHFNPVFAPETSPSLAVLFGINPSVTCGYVGTGASNWPKRLQELRDRGGELWVVDPRRTKTASFADQHLAPRSGTDVFLLGFLVRELLAEGYNADELAAACDPEDRERLSAAVANFTLDVVAERTGLDADDILNLLAAIRRHGQVAMVGGTGLGFGPNGLLAFWLMWAVLILTGSLDRDGGMKFHPMMRSQLDGPPLEGHAPAEGSHTPGPPSRPDLDGFLGEYPSMALVDEIEAGNVKSLVIYGGSPLTAIPEPDRLLAALRKLEVLVVMEIFDNELASIATHVVPCTWITERASFLYGPMFGSLRSHYSPAVVPAAADRRQAWWVLAQVARRIGIDSLHGLDPDVVDDETVVRHLAGQYCDYADEVIANGPAGMEVPFRQGWFHEKVLPEGRWRIAPQVLVDRLPDVWNYDADRLQMVCGRIMKRLNAMPWALRGADNTPPPIQVSTDAAQERGIESGDRVRVSTRFGAVEGWAELNPTLAPQTLWVSHGWLEQNVNHIIDPNPDPLTGQPIMSAFPVELERLSSPSTASTGMDRAAERYAR